MALHPREIATKWLYELITRRSFIGRITELAVLDSSFSVSVLTTICPAKTPRVRGGCGTARLRASRAVATRFRSVIVEPHGLSVGFENVRAVAR